MKIYLATPMNGRPIEDIKEKIADCASLLAKKGIDFFNPFSEAIAMDNAVDGVVEDKRPVEILCNAAKYIEDCSSVLFIGSMDELRQSLGCQVELVIAVNYGKGFYLYDDGEIIEIESLELTWKFSRRTKGQLR